MIDNSISILGQVISIILGMFSTYIVLNFMHNFKRNVFYKKYVYIIVYIVFTLLIFFTISVSIFNLCLYCEELFHKSNT